MALRTAGSVLVVLLLSVAETTATQCGQKIQVMVSPTNAVWGQNVTVTCNTTCTLTDNPTYIWYKNGQRLSSSSKSTLSATSYHSASYSCAVKGFEDLLSPAVCVFGHYCFNVTYTHQSICALKGSTVELPCTYRHPNIHNVLQANWYIQEKRDEVLRVLNLDRAEYLKTLPKYLAIQEKDCTLKITDLRKRDSAEYKFRFKTQHTEWGYSFPGTTLTVTGLQVKVTPAAEKGNLTLTCSTTCTLTENPKPTYIWYKNGQHLTNSKILDNSLILDPVSSEDAGRYSCAVKGHNNLYTPEETLTVIYPPKNPSVSVSPSGEIVEGSSVTLTCSSDANPPVDKYTWYFQNETLINGFEQIYNITNFRSEDSGHYHCEAWNKMASKNSTDLIIITVKQTSVLTAAVGIIGVVLVLILCLSGFMWFRKNASQPISDTRDTVDNRQGNSSPMNDNISGMAMTPTSVQRADTDNQDDVHYTSIHFSGSNNEEVPLYSTVQLPQTQKEDEDVQYAVVKFKLPQCCPPTSLTGGPLSQEDLSHRRTSLTGGPLSQEDLSHRRTSLTGS
ncbi:B-cell receptor CD22-like isoform X3 [Oncorhynchus nerka]|uniref:B-cell receptor CD22-like isoform X3 n=1 Tax=Oncorhynchus nerka TaxID=8023 RepID=UPI0031B806CC